jgi:hypothetical protein
LLKDSFLFNIFFFCFQISLKGGYVTTQKENLRVTRKSNALDKPIAGSTPARSSAVESAPEASGAALPPVCIAFI